MEKLSTLIKKVFIGKNNINNMEKTTEDEMTSVHKLSHIFATEPTDNELRNEEIGFYVIYEAENNVIKVRINTFVNPYTQDVQSVYKERLARLAFLEPIAKIDANKPSKLGGRQVALTMPVAEVTDDMLKRLKDVIYQMHSA